MRRFYAECTAFCLFGNGKLIENGECRKLYTSETDLSASRSQKKWLSHLLLAATEQRAASVSETETQFDTKRANLNSRLFSLRSVFLINTLHTVWFMIAPQPNRLRSDGIVDISKANRAVCVLCVESIATTKATTATQSSRISENSGWICAKWLKTNERFVTWWLVANVAVHASQLNV